jgi:hypothetical protein
VDTPLSINDTGDVSNFSICEFNAIKIIHDNPLYSVEEYCNT